MCGFLKWNNVKVYGARKVLHRCRVGCWMVDSPPAAKQASVWPLWDTLRSSHSRSPCRLFSPHSGMPSVNSPDRICILQVGKAKLAPPKQASENSHTKTPPQEVDPFSSHNASHLESIQYLLHRLQSNPLLTRWEVTLCVAGSGTVVPQILGTSRTQ